MPNIRAEKELIVTFHFSRLILGRQAYNLNFIKMPSNSFHFWEHFTQQTNAQFCPVRALMDRLGFDHAPLYLLGNAIP